MKIYYKIRYILKYIIKNKGIKKDFSYYTEMK
jgi:hypothetical protein